MKRALVFIEMFDKLSNATFVIELVGALRFLTFILNRDAYSLVEESLFSESLGKFVKTKNGVIKDLRIRVESDLCAAFACLAGLRQTLYFNPPNVILLISFCVSPDLEM